MTEEMRIEEEIGYTFADAALLKNALTHSSYVNENRERDPLLSSNERLEFLGDAVLQLLISRELYRTFPELDEGALTQFRQHLVCEATLARAAARLKLGTALYLGRGENAGRERPSTLSDALEAIVAAVYLDSLYKDAEAPARVVRHILAEEIEDCRKLRGGDYKTRILQLVQGDGAEILTYETVSETGPAHDKTFRVVAKLNSNVIGEGEGKSKREAEQMAAKEALSLFGIKE